MKIVWNPNPLCTAVLLDDADRKLLWHRVKIERLEDRIGDAYFDLDPEHQVWCRKSFGEPSQIDSVADARRHLDYPYVCGDAKRKGVSFDGDITRRTDDYIAELAKEHHGDCTCMPCSCLKCHAESLVGVDTLARLGKHEASFILGAFARKGGGPRTLDEAIAYLRDYDAMDVPEWGRPHAERWKEEATRAHAWLVAYQREHFSETTIR